MAELETVYQHLEQQAVSKDHFFGRPLVVVPYIAFEEYMHLFKKSTNYLNAKENFRTTDTFRHIHAIKTDNLIEFHYDYGNPDKGVFFAFIHLCVDMIPYFIYRLLTFNKPYKI